MCCSSNCYSHQITRFITKSPDISCPGYIWRSSSTGDDVQAREHLFVTTEQKTQVDSWLQKLDKDFIGNWITYLFYTYFINDTRFYIFCQHYSIICQQKKAEKNESIQNKTKPEVRMEDKIILYCVSLFRRLKHNPNANKQTLDSKQKHTNGSNANQEGKERGWEPIKMAGEGDVSSMIFDSSFTLKLRTSERRGREVSLVVGAPELEGAQLNVDEEEVN